MSSRALAAVSCSLAALASAVLLVVPTYNSMSATMSTDGAARFETASRSLLAVNGPKVILFLLFPVVVSAATLLVPRRLPTVARVVRATAGFLIFAFVLVGAFSIGLFYLPAAGVMMLAAGAVEDTRTRRTRDD